MIDQFFLRNCKKVSRAAKKFFTKSGFLKIKGEIYFRMCRFWENKAKFIFRIEASAKNRGQKSFPSQALKSLKKAQNRPKFAPCIR
jgi:hypothetical protein